MFGYATDETEECMPLTVVLAHKLNQKIADLRRTGDFWWARPDSKTQVRCIFCGCNKYVCIAGCIENCPHSNVYQTRIGVYIGYARL